MCCGPICHKLHRVLTQKMIEAKDLRKMFHREKLFVATMIALVLVFAGRSVAQDASIKPAAEAKTKVTRTVALTIEFPGEVELHYKAIAFTEGMTVFDALSAAAKHARPLRFKHTGSGEFAFLTEIDGVKNEGASGKNWTYKVDGERAKVGMGSMKLKEGSHILWLMGS